MAEHKAYGAEVSPDASMYLKGMKALDPAQRTEEMKSHLSSHLVSIEALEMVDALPLAQQKKREALLPAVALLCWCETRKVLVLDDCAAPLQTIIPALPLYTLKRIRLPNRSMRYQPELLPFATFPHGLGDPSHMTLSLLLGGYLTAIAYLITALPAAPDHTSSLGVLSALIAWCDERPTQFAKLFATMPPLGKDRTLTPLDFLRLLHRRRLFVSRNVRFATVLFLSAALCF